MPVASFKMSDAQAELCQSVVKQSPWYYRQARGCDFEYYMNGDSRLEFQFAMDDFSYAYLGSAARGTAKYENSDEFYLHGIFEAAKELGWPKRTCESLKKKMHAAADKARRKIVREAA